MFLGSLDSVVDPEVAITIFLNSKSTRPSGYNIEIIKTFDGTLIIMKAGSKLKELKYAIRNDGKTAYLIENCGMQNEIIYYGVDMIPDKTGYFSILIVTA